LNEIEICLNDLCFRASLLKKEAPKTCKAYWDALPIEGEAHHGELAGSEFYFNFIRPIAKLERENKYFLNELKPGDICGGGGGIAFFYSDVSPEPYPENLFACVTKKEELKKMRKMGYKIWYKPGGKIIIRRFEGTSEAI